MNILIGAIIGIVSGVLANRVADALIAAHKLPQRVFPGRVWLVVGVAVLTHAFLAMRFGLTLDFALTVVYTFVFLVVCITDLEHRLIFNFVILPAILFALIASPFSRLGWKLSLLGGVTAFVLVLGMYLFAQVFARIRKINVEGGAFGQGDVKLATFMGLVVGFPNVFPAILYTILLGGVGALIFLAYQFVVHRRVTLTAAMPYGPFFCIAGWVMMQM
ncbi:MAG: A24 family peptidase [Anaerolineae bacterium]|nr:A24 family peptidase [Anaerolineae bacterium]